ncbi:tetratricopeptide repeat protein [Campylobacter ureolyticus]|uniref:Tetratricopeptide repeat lipoprotein n=1 Tax=Campylobacter ureolyticus TaxID=827 RepID=A0AAE7EAH7_9BACT|nr:tetratricopeptide repeat protein [Campylobacter ureolyticus]MCR8685510.1 tetratricopeptide repeat protein [Campylobacter ureolyticus]QKF84618.1 putative tetratricopeptide repeat lipoprotein [Campylobacter ureolyticus]QQY35217.1 tetratricopeptide repeat protein [Campylobacter ureolyticus]SUX21927.1 TPR repeat-containing protein [Campylobacter ureolyticus]
MHRCKTIIKCLFISLFCLNLNAFDTKSYDESLNVFKALLLEEKDPKDSVSIFTYLYDKTKKPEYLKEVIKILYNYEDFTNLGFYLEKGSVLLKDDDEFLRIKIAYLLSKNSLYEALNLARNLTKIDNSARSFIILGKIEEVLNLQNETFKSYKKAYELDENEINFLRYVKVLLSMKQTDEALKELESYKKENGCSLAVCSMLVDIYRQQNDFDMVVKICEELYEDTKNSKFLDYILSFYITFEEYDKAVDLLKKYDYKNKMLVELYGFLKQNDKAIKLSKEFFKKTNDTEFLALEAMNLYEKNAPNVNQKLLKEILDKFDKSIKDLNNATYENYYGYLLIDHDIDYKKGIEFVKKALLKEPDSPYYLDSLAWGYYKLKECKKADEIMKQISYKFSDFLNSSEAKEHFEAINKCLNSGDIK